MKYFYIICLFISFNLKGQIVPQGFLVGPDYSITPSITIGTQTWMLYNLNVVSYTNGDPITNITDGTLWKNATEGAYSDYNTISQAAGYGKLYNWTVVNDARGVCPFGWHVPSDAEFLVLANFYGGDASAGTSVSSEELRLTSTWTSSASFASTNSSGFSAIAAGFRDVETTNGTFIGGPASGVGTNAHFWTSTKYNTTTAVRFGLYYNSSQTARVNDALNNGASIRCIK